MDAPSIPGLARTINRVARALAREGDAVLKPLGLRFAQVPVLVLLRDSAGMTQKELAAASGIEQPSMAQLLGRMERDGLIRREQNPHDARSQTVVLTEVALPQFAAARRKLADLDKRAVAGFTAAEVRTLQVLLDRVNDNLAAERA